MKRTMEKKSVKIMENFHQNHTYFSKILNLCLTDINIYPIYNKIDNFSEKYIFKRKESKRVGIFSILGPNPLFHETYPRIRIHIKMKWIRNTASNSKTCFFKHHPSSKKVFHILSAAFNSRSM